MTAGSDHEDGTAAGGMRELKLIGECASCAASAAAGKDDTEDEDDEDDDMMY